MCTSAYVTGYSIKILNPVKPLAYELAILYSRFYNLPTSFHEMILANIFCSCLDLNSAGIKLKTLINFANQGTISQSRSEI